jgi:hypothetical protein
MKKEFIKRIKKSRRGQDEMVGFGLIIVLVAVILLVFVASTLKKSTKDNIESYESSSFIQAVLQQTTVCEKDLKNIDVKELIFECANEGINEKRCSNNLKACLVLNNTIKEIAKETWKVGGDNITKGYDLVIVANSKPIVGIFEGVSTKNSKGNYQDFANADGNDKVSFYFTAYY